MDVLDLPEGKVRVRRAGDAGPSVLLCVDPPNVLEQYATLAARLKRHARVAAFEPPGFGQSRRARGVGYGLDDQARAVVSLLERLGGGPWVLAFPCVAAYAALLVAARRPDLVAGLALAQAPSFSDEARWAARVDKRGLLRTPGVGQAVLFLRQESLARTWYEAALPEGKDARAFGAIAVEAMTHGARFPLAGAFQAIFRGPAPDLPVVDKPALLVWGAKDRTHRASDPAGLRANLPRAESVVLPDCGHFPELEAPAAYVEALTAWMRRAGLA